MCDQNVRSAISGTPLQCLDAGLRAEPAGVSHIDVKVVLLDGIQIASLMIDHGVGVTPVATYVVKRLDSDYFEEV